MIQAISGHVDCWLLANQVYNLFNPSMSALLWFTKSFVQKEWLLENWENTVKEQWRRSNSRDADEAWSAIPSLHLGVQFSSTVAKLLIVTLCVRDQCEGVLIYAWARSLTCKSLSEISCRRLVKSSRMRTITSSQKIQFIFKGWYRKLNYFNTALAAAHIRFTPITYHIL